MIGHWQDAHFFLRPHAASLAWLALLAVATGLAEVLVVASTIPLLASSFDVEATGGISGVVTRMAALLPLTSPLANAGLLFTLAILAAAALRIGHTWYQYRLMLKVVVRVKSQLFRGLLFSDYSYFVGSRRGTLIHRVVKSPDDVGQLIYVVSNLTFLAITSGILLGFLFVLSWPLTTIVLVFGIVFQYVSGKWGQRRIHVISKKQVAAAQLETHVLSETVEGIRHVKAYGTEEAIHAKYQAAAEANLGSYVRGKIYSQMPGLLMRTAAFASLGLGVVILGLGPSATVAARLPQYATLGFGLLRLIPPLTQLVDMRLLLAGASANLSLIRRALSESGPTIRDGAHEFPGVRGSIEFRDVRFAHEGGSEVLRGLHLTIPRNRVVALVGASGSGKSTVFDLLLRLHDPSSGVIEVDGTNLREYTLRSWRGRVALVSQDPFLVHASVEENIRFGMQASREDVVQAARLAHADEFIERLPEGYGTSLGDRGIRLSGGQRQRIAIARALLRKPEILLLDEATSALDAESERIIQETLRGVARGTTVIVIAHRLSTVAAADRIVVLHDGVIAEQGTHDELLSRRGRYWSYFHTQVSEVPQAQVPSGGSS